MPPRRPTAPPASARAAQRPGSTSRPSTGARGAGATRPSSGPRPAASRPATAARPSATARPPAARRPAILRPVTMVSGTLVVLVLLLAPSLKPWFEQRAELARLREQVATSRQDVAALEEERRRWQDPEFVRAQARERLDFVLPGERRYVVLDDRPVTAATDPSAAAAAQVASNDQAWFGDLWRSVEVAGRPESAGTVGGPAADPATPPSTAPSGAPATP